MAINLELPRKLHAVIDKAHQGAAEMMRPIARKYDLKEHAYPVELDTLAELFAGATESNTLDMAGAGELKASESAEENRNGANMAAALQALEASWGDAAMLLSIPFQGLGNAAVSAVASDEQLQRLGADKGMQIGLDGVQLLGGHGYTKEHPVERWYRDLRAIGIAEGVVII